MSQSRENYEDWWHDRTEGIGLATALDARSVYRITTPQHEIEVLAHDGLGWVLTVDGVLQAVQQDSGHREMLIHVPLLGKDRRVCRVLLLGGGDGAILHEVLKHPFVSSVLLCEPEPAMIDVGRQYLGFGSDLSDPRVAIRRSAWEPTADDTFDVIVSARPGNLPSNIGGSLAQGGVCVDSDWVVLGKGQARWYRGALKSPLPSVEQYYTVGELSPGGFIGFFLYTMDGHSYSEPRLDHSSLFYNPRLHRAAFALPSFWQDFKR